MNDTKLKSMAENFIKAMKTVPSAYNVWDDLVGEAEWSQLLDALTNEIEKKLGLLQLDDHRERDFTFVVEINHKKASDETFAELVYKLAHCSSWSVGKMRHKVLYRTNNTVVGVITITSRRSNALAAWTPLYMALANSPLLLGEETIYGKLVSANWFVYTNDPFKEWVKQNYGDDKFPVFWNNTLSIGSNKSTSIKPLTLDENNNLVVQQ